MYMDSAGAIWQDLKTRFAHSNAPKLFHLKQAIASLKQEDLSVSAYHTRIKALWDEFDSFRPREPCSCGAGKYLLDSHNQDRLMKFLQGLHDHYATLRSNVLLMDPFPHVNKIYNLVRQEEQQQNINTSSAAQVESAALNFKGDRHNPFLRSNNNNNKRPRPFCDHCNRYGHTKQT